MEVNASHYLGRAPYWLQFIAETEATGPAAAPTSPDATSQSVVPAVAPVQDSVGRAVPPLPSAMVYWFSGTNQTETGVAEQWRIVSGGQCICRDTKLDANHIQQGLAVLQRTGSLARTC